MILENILLNSFANSFPEAACLYRPTTVTVAIEGRALVGDRLDTLWERE